MTKRGYWVVGTLVALILLMVFTPSSVREVQGTVVDVFHDDFADDWAVIKSELGAGREYQVTSFQMEYTRDGKIRSFYWIVSEQGQGESCRSYQISQGVEGTYRISDDWEAACQSGFITVEEFLKMVTGEMIRGVTPDEPYDYAMMKVSTKVETYKDYEGDDVFGWNGSRVEGPIRNGQGYVARLITMHKTDEKVDGGEHWSGKTRLNILLGGTYE